MISFLESGLVLIVGELALNSNVKDQFMAMNFSGLLVFQLQNT